MEKVWEQHEVLLASSFRAGQYTELDSPYSNSDSSDCWGAQRGQCHSPVQGAHFPLFWIAFQVSLSQKLHIIAPFFCQYTVADFPVPRRAKVWLRRSAHWRRDPDVALGDPIFKAPTFNSVEIVRSFVCLRRCGAVPASVRPVCFWHAIAFDATRQHFQEVLPPGRSCRSH